MATSSRRELDGFLTSATHSKRCTGQGIEVDSTFRRFRFAVLRKAGVPENLIKLWMGRREWCEKAGLRFELGELGYKSLAPIRPLLVA
jgi:hypothetical protein